LHLHFHSIESAKKKTVRLSVFIYKSSQMELNHLLQHKGAA